MSLSTAGKNASAGAVAALIDGGPAAGTIDVRTGAKPATPADAATGTLLFTWTFADPAAAAPSGGVAVIDTSPVITTNAVAGGTAGWFRIKDSTGAVVYDGTQGVELVLDNPVIVNGQTVNLTAGTITQS